MTMDVYNQLKQPPKEALRTIQGGRLSGKTDINPQWRYKAMTEQFGMVGAGWKYEIVRVFSEPASDGQVFAFAEVNLYVRVNDAWSDPIPGYGGSMLIEKEKAGLHSSDEGYKMAITDALSTSMKMLGVAADIYAGLWDGTKYKDAPAGKAKDPAKTPEGEMCPIHNVPFKLFTKGDQKWYSHKAEDGWCNKDKVKSKIDMGWLKESLETLNWADAGKYLRERYNASGTSVKQLVESLSPEQQEEFVAEVQERLD